MDDPAGKKAAYTYKLERTGNTVVFAVTCLDEYAAMAVFDRAAAELQNHNRLSFRFGRPGGQSGAAGRSPTRR